MATLKKVYFIQLYFLLFYATAIFKTFSKLDHLYVWRLTIQTVLNLFSWACITIIAQYHNKSVKLKPVIHYQSYKLLIVKIFNKSF